MTAAPSHTTAPTAGEAAEAVERLLDRLEGLSAVQAEALSVGNDDRLLSILSEKQTALDAGDLPGLLRAAGSDRVPIFMKRIETLLQQDGEALALATARRDEAADELSSLGAASAAQGAYGDVSASAPASRRLNVAG